MSLATLPTDCLLQILKNVAVRDILSLGCACRSFQQLIQDDSIWRALAEQKWGAAVPQLAERVAEGGWQSFCRHRINTVSLPPSPLDLVQERYPDPWQHLASTILCSRTTGGPVVRQAIAALLEALPTPSAVLGAEQAAVWELLHPLGLQAARYCALYNMSHDFLAKDWQDPAEFKGCGRFCSDSWRIFCRGHRGLRDVEDRNLQAYLRWLTKGVLEERRGGGRKQKATEGSAGRKRKLDRQEAASCADQHWLRSRGGKRGGGGGSQQATPDAPDRRVTRSAAAAAKRR